MTEPIPQEAVREPSPKTVPFFTVNMQTGLITTVNVRAAKDAKVPEDELVNRNIKDFLPPGTDLKKLAVIVNRSARLLSQSNISSADAQLPTIEISVGGKTLFIELHSEKVKTKSATEFNLVAIDITKRVLDEREAVKRSRRDPMTGLPNREVYDERMNIEIERSIRMQQPVSLLMVDIDKFKNVNDTFGHSVGDLKILQIVTLLKSQVRDIDIVCRWGGEEFAVILTQTGVEAMEVAERVRKAFADLCETPESKASFSDKGKTISIGVSTFTPEKIVTDELKSPETRTREITARSELLFKQTDSALYEAKNTGRNKVVLYVSTMTLRDRKEVN